MAASSHAFDTPNAPVQVRIKTERIDDPSKEFRVRLEIMDFEVSVKVEPAYEDDQVEEDAADVLKMEDGDVLQNMTYQVKVENMSENETENCQELEQSMPQLMVRAEYSDHDSDQPDFGSKITKLKKNKHAVKENEANQECESSSDSDISLAHMKREIEDNLSHNRKGLKGTAASSKNHRYKLENTKSYDDNNKINNETEAKKFSCDVCYKKFKYISYLVQHQNIHSGEKVFSCDSCGKKFNTKSSMLRHKIIHTGQKPFICEVCNRPFRFNSDLHKHKLIHTDEKPYSCDVCQKKFRRSNHLIEHKHTHSGDKPFYCKLCNKDFRYSSNFIKHRQIHEGFKGYPCNLCNKYFTRRNYLTQHMNIHRGEKPYSCDVCEKKFVNTSNLMRHKLVHSGARPFSCNYCEKTFKQSTHMSLHKQKFHSEEVKTNVNY